jgi:hypothetical protein
MTIILLGTELFVTDERTDGHDEDNNRFSEFCGCA